MAVVGIVMMCLVMTYAPCVDAGTDKIHVEVEEGGGPYSIPTMERPRTNTDLSIGTGPPG